MTLSRKCMPLAWPLYPLFALWFPRGRKSAPRPERLLWQRSMASGAAEASAAGEAVATPSPKPPKSSSSTARAYSLRPAFNHKFRSSLVKECIHVVLKEELAGVQYSSEEMPTITKQLSEKIRDTLKEKGFHRYKIVVQVVIGEQRGEGVNMAARCFWDADTDSYAQDVFMNDSLFCVAAAFGCFYY